MRVKSFRGGDAKSVLARIRSELGPDAVILSNQTIKEDGQVMCEIMAALENEEVFEEAAAPEISLETAPADRPLTGEFNREWNELRGHILSLIRPGLDLQSLAPKQRAALEHLEREGVDVAVLFNLAAELKSGRESSVLQLLSRALKALAFDDNSWSQKFHAFAGPHGVGKTSTVLRLALAHKRANPGQKVCLVNADGGRGKGRLILRHYAELSGLGFVDFSPGDSLDQLKNVTQGFQKVFIDLPGLPASVTLAGWIKQAGLNALGQLAVHLLLSPHYSNRQLKGFCAKYACANLASLIWTKLDEACAFGEVVNMAHHTGLVVSALSFGAGMKQSLAPADGQSLMRLIFKREFPGQVQETEACRRLQ